MTWSLIGYDLHYRSVSKYMRDSSIFITFYWQLWRQMWRINVLINTWPNKRRHENRPKWIAPNRSCESFQMPSNLNLRLKVWKQYTVLITNKYNCFERKQSAYSWNNLGNLHLKYLSISTVYRFIFSLQIDSYFANGN